MSPNTNIGSGTCGTGNNSNGTEASGCSGTSDNSNSNSTRPNNDEMEVVNVNSHGVSDNLTETTSERSPLTFSFSDNKNLVSESQESLIDRSLRYLDSGKYSDLTLIIGKKEIKAHKMILMMSSPFFETQLENDPDIRELKVDGVQYDEFWLFLEYLYSRVTPTKVEDVWPVLRCAIKFQVPCLADAACKLLESAMSMPATTEAKNSALSGLNILEVAITYNQNGLKESALNYISKNAFQILGSRQFTMLSSEALELIIARDDLCAFDEMQVFNAVMRWAVPEYSEGFEDSITEEQKRVLCSYFGFVRFGQMTKIEFQKYCLSLNVLEPEDALLILQCFDLAIEERLLGNNIPCAAKIDRHGLTIPRDYYKPVGPANKVETANVVTNKHDYWLQKSQLRFCFDKAGWISHICLAPSVYDNYELTVKCKVKLSNADNSNKEVIYKVVRKIGTVKGQCPIIKFDKPVRIQAGKWYSITARIVKKVALAQEYYIYKCEAVATKGQFVGENGEVVEFKLDPAFTNNEVTEVGFICQPDDLPDLPDQVGPCETEGIENELNSMAKDEVVVVEPHVFTAAVIPPKAPEESESVSEESVRIFAYELPLSDNLIKGKEILVVCSIDNYKHLVISKKDREQFQHFQTELNKSQDLIPYKGIPQVGELVVVLRKISSRAWHRGVVTNVDDNQKVSVDFIDTFGCVVVSAESSDIRYLDKNSIEVPLLGAIINTSTRIRRSLQGNSYNLKLLGRHEERLYEYRGHLELSNIDIGCST